METVAEPHLVREGLIGRTPRGRVALPAAWGAPGFGGPRDSALGHGPGVRPPTGLAFWADRR